MGVGGGGGPDRFRFSTKSLPLPLERRQPRTGSRTRQGVSTSADAVCKTILVSSETKAALMSRPSTYRINAASYAVCWSCSRGTSHSSVTIGHLIGTADGVR